MAAVLLQSKGYEVIGITMCFNLADSSKRRPSCCGLESIEDARRVSHKLGIKHYLLNMQKELEKYVISDFCQQYLHGQTPNPCIRCNQYLKFDLLLKKALSLEAKFLATGHYARIDTTLNPKLSTLNYSLKKAKDSSKDQSYFLYRLTQKQLRHILFPLGNYTKKEVRRMAKRFALPVAEKLASQEICFLPDWDYRQFLKSRVAEEIKPGLIKDTQGNILGEHQGVAFYTIGQRQGLGIARGYPLYVLRLKAKENELIVGRKEEAYTKEFFVREVHFIGGSPQLKKRIVLKVRIRYNQRESPAELIPLEDKIKVKFKKPQFAVTPGQSAVFYHQETVLGGGIIDVLCGLREKN